MQNKNFSTLNKLIDKLYLGIAIIFVAILPWVFFPGLFEFYESAKFLAVMVFVVISLLYFSYKSLFTSKFEIKTTPFDLPILVWFFSGLLATLLSLSSITSLWGYYGRVGGSFVAIVLLIVLFYIFIQNKLLQKSFKLILRTLIFSTAILGLFTLLQVLNVLNPLWEGINVLNLNSVFSNQFSPVADPASLFVLFRILLPISVGLLLKDIVSKKGNFIKGIDLVQITLLIFGSLSAFLIYDAKPAMFIVGLVGFLLLVFIVRKQLKLLVKYLIVPVVLGLLLAIILFVPQIKDVLSMPEITTQPSLDYLTALNVANNSLEDKGISGYIFGNGLETYPYTFSTHKPVEYNQNDLWAVRFGSAPSEALNIMQEMGLFGVLSMLLFFAVFVRLLVVKAKKEVLEANDKNTLFATVSVSVFVGILSFILLPISAVTWIVFVVLVAFFVSEFNKLSSPKSDDNKILLNLNFEKVQSYYSYLPSLLILTLTLLAIVFYAKNVLGDFNFRKSIDSLQGNNIQESLEYAKIAVNYAPEKPYLNRNLSIISLTMAESVLNTQANSIDEQTQNGALFDSLVKQSVYYIQTAIEQNPIDVETREASSQIFASLYYYTNGQDYGVDTLSALRNTIALDPYNPKHQINLGLFLYRTSQIDEAEVTLRNAYNLRPDYASSIVSLGSVLEEKEDLSDAKAFYESALSQVSDPLLINEINRRLDTLGENSFAPRNNDIQIEEPISE